MSELLIQQRLREGHTVETLIRIYALKVKPHSKYPNLLQFKYDQLESPMGEPLVQQCRGLILDSADDWKVVARPFDRFFNFGEGHAAVIDWKTARVQEKLDGSLIIMYWYDGHWEVATSGSPDASGEVNDSGETFAQLFWRLFALMEYEVPMDCHRGITFMWELMHPANRVVVKHIENSLTLIGARNRTSEGSEYPLDFPFQRAWEVVKEFPLQSLDDIIKTFDQMDPLQQEGYVIVDAAFNRIKVKHPGYVALHHMKGEGFSTKRAVEIVRGGESAEVLVAFPEWAGDMQKVQTAYDSLIFVIDDAWEEYRSIEVQKDFALAIAHLPFSGVLFGLRNGKVTSIVQALKDMSIDKLMELLNLGGVQE